MKYIVTNNQMKNAEAYSDNTHISYAQLMENAGKACADRIAAILPRCKTVVLCGKGNNGGDGYVIARHLAEYGFPVAIVAAGAPSTEISRQAAARAQKLAVLLWGEEKDASAAAIRQAEIVVDCVFGTGFHGTLENSLAELFSEANSVQTRIAVDVPSGVDSDSGDAAQGCFLPTHTFLLAGIKHGLISNQPCNDILGEISIIDIGMNDEDFSGGYEAVITSEELCRPYPSRARSTHKGSMGRLLNIAGSYRFNGAAAISTLAALRCGAGLCTLAAPRSCINIVAPTLHECTYIPLPENESGNAAEPTDELCTAIKSANAVSVGCGMGNSENTRKIVEFVLKNAVCPVIIDADGINSICSNIDILKERRNCEVILTPHPMEFSRMSGVSVKELQRDRISHAKAFSEKYNVTIVLKGANTVIASHGKCFVNICGNYGLAKGGSGDALTGIIASLCAQGISPETGAYCGVFFHASAADILARTLPEESILPTDIISVLPQVIRRSK